MSIVTQSELERIRAGFDPVPEQSYSLDAACYLEPRFFELDRRSIFHRSWQFLCHEEKLRKPGSYVAADIQGQSVFAARDNKGELRAFYNVCKHRGHELLSGEGNTKVVTCPLSNRSSSCRKLAVSEFGGCGKTVCPRLPSS